MVLESFFIDFLFTYASHLIFPPVMKHALQCMMPPSVTHAEMCTHMHSHHQDIETSE